MIRSRWQHVLSCRAALLCSSRSASCFRASARVLFFLLTQLIVRQIETKATHTATVEQMIAAMVTSDSDVTAIVWADMATGPTAFDADMKLRIVILCELIGSRYAKLINYSDIPANILILFVRNESETRPDEAPDEAPRRSHRNLRGARACETPDGLFG